MDTGIHAGMTAFFALVGLVYNDERSPWERRGRHCASWNSRNGREPALPRRSVGASKSCPFHQLQQIFRTDLAADFAAFQQAIGEVALLPVQGNNLLFDSAFGD